MVFTESGVAGHEPLCPSLAMSNQVTMDLIHCHTTADLSQVRGNGAPLFIDRMAALTAQSLDQLKSWIYLLIRFSRLSLYWDSTDKK